MVIWVSRQTLDDAVDALGILLRTIIKDASQFKLRADDSSRHFSTSLIELQGQSISSSDRPRVLCAECGLVLSWNIDGKDLSISPHFCKDV
jgi:hypothetical protein